MPLSLCILNFKRLYAREQNYFVAIQAFDGKRKSCNGDNINKNTLHVFRFSHFVFYYCFGLKLCDFRFLCVLSEILSAHMHVQFIYVISLRKPKCQCGLNYENRSQWFLNLASQ